MERKHILLHGTTNGTNESSVIMQEKSLRSVERALNSGWLDKTMFYSDF